MNTDKHRYFMRIITGKLLKNRLSLSVFICVHLWIILLTSCTSKPTDLRTVIPADALVYLESNDLGKALGAITENKIFQQLAKSKPDLSALDGIKLAVAVTGFETSEEQITEENSVLNFQPRFVAAVETNAWNFQAVSFTENKIGEFINDVYGGSVELETSDKHGGKYFVWTAQDGRKAYALVQGSVIFFGNDEPAIEKCLAVKRGEADSIAKNAKVTALPADSLASGYVSTDGVAQIANIVGVKFANEAGEEPEVQSAIAGILPQLLRGSISEVVWTATKTEKGIEDKYLIAMPPDVANVFAETLVETGKPQFSLLDRLPDSTSRVTLYDLTNPLVAWHSVLLVAQKQTDPLTGKIVEVFSSALFEEYGVRDAEMFLASVGPTIVTANMDESGDKQVVIASIKDKDKLLKSLTAPLKLTTVSYQNGRIELLRSDDQEFAADINGETIVLGETESVLRLLSDGRSPDKQGSLISKMQTGRPAAAITVAIESTKAREIVNLLTEKKDDNLKVETSYFIETRFTKTGIERHTVSDFGLIGSIIEQFGKE